MTESTEPTLERDEHLSGNLEETVHARPVRNAIFAAEADDPRARRMGDVVRLVASVLIVFFTGWSYRKGNDLDDRVVDAFAGDLPAWISAPLTIIYIGGGIYAAVLLISILLFGRGRAAVARDMFLAGLLAGMTAIGSSFAAGSKWPDLIPELLERDGLLSFPVVRLAATTAVILVARPYMAVPMRRVGGRLLGGMVFASILLGYGAVSAVIGGLAVGVGAAAVVHLTFGSGVGIPSLARIRDALTTIGVDVADIDYIEEQPIGATLLRGELASGGSVGVKVYGRDAADAAFVARAWRSAWYRDSHRPVSATGLQQVEHETLALLDARRAGAPVPELVGWGPANTGDALVVIRWEEATRLSSLAPEKVDDEFLAGCWRALTGLHDAGIVHREIDTEGILSLDDRVVLSDLSGSAKSFDPLEQAADVAQMFVATAVVAGPDRAIAAARAAIGDAALTDALPVVQASALTGRLQQQAKAAELKMKDLRTATTDALGTEAPPLVQLARVTWGNVAMVVLTLVAASALISALTDIGLDTIADEVANASWAWIVTAFVLAQLTNVGEWVSLTGFVPGVPFGPTFRFRYAISFISLAVPSDAGAIAMNIRYMQKQGVPWTAAAAQGPLLTIFSKGFDVLLLLLSAKVIGETVDLDEIDGGPALRLLLLVVVLVIVGVIVTLIVPKLRNRVVPPIKEGMSAIRETVTDPQRLLRVASGTLMQKMLFAMTLTASAHAYGGSIGLTEAIFVNSIVSLFLGLMPVPGGIGVGEAALSAGLVAMGMPESSALAAAVTHRMVTNYLPPIYGWYTSRWLTANDYL